MSAERTRGFGGSVAPRDARSRTGKRSRRWKQEVASPPVRAPCPRPSGKGIRRLAPGSGGLLRSWADYSSRPPGTFLFCFISVCFLFIYSFCH